MSTSEAMIMDDLIVSWYDVDGESQLQAQGVTTIGYVKGVLIGFNEVVIGDLVGLSDPDGLLERKYDHVRICRRSNEIDQEERCLGMLQPQFSQIGPWRVVSVTSDGSFGVSQRIDQDNSDLLVRPDQVKKRED